MVDIGSERGRPAGVRDEKHGVSPWLPLLVHGSRDQCHPLHTTSPLPDLAPGNLALHCLLNLTKPPQQLVAGNALSLPVIPRREEIGPNLLVVMGTLYEMILYLTTLATAATTHHGLHLQWNTLHTVIASFFPIQILSLSSAVPVVDVPKTLNLMPTSFDSLSTNAPR